MYLLDYWLIGSHSFLSLLALGTCIYLLVKKAFLPAALVCLFFWSPLLPKLIPEYANSMHIFFCRIVWIFYLWEPIILMLLYGYLLKMRSLIKIFAPLNFLLSTPLWLGFLYFAIHFYGIPATSPKTLEMEIVLPTLVTLFVPFIYGQFLIILLDHQQTSAHYSWVQPLVKAILLFQLVSLINYVVELFGMIDYLLHSSYFSFFFCLIDFSSLALAIGCSIAIYTKTNPPASEIVHV